MERRAFIKTSVVGSGALLLGLPGCSVSTPDAKPDSTLNPQDTKDVFLEKGTCSQTFAYLLDREFGYPMENEERASDPFAGGVLQRGHQCGMIWGASLAVGAESFRRFDDRDQAIGRTITATRHLVASFSNTANNINCRDITDCDLTSPFGIAKLILFKRNTCLNLSEQWAPEAIRSATEALSRNPTDLSPYPKNCMSCASEVAKKMGASDKEMAMVAGFAGGLGLSGHACGALSAAVWMKQLAWQRKQTGSKPDLESLSEAFDSVTGSKNLCHQISGQRFKTVEHHTDYIKNGGCRKLINTLAQS